MAEKAANTWEKSLEEGEKLPGMFKTPEYSEWDADGLPTKDAQGAEVAKSKRKQLAKVIFILHSSVPLAHVHL